MPHVMNMKPQQAAAPDGANRAAVASRVMRSEVNPPDCLTEAEFDAKMLESISESDQEYRIPTHMCVHWAGEVLRDGKRKAKEAVKKKQKDCFQKNWKWRQAKDPKDCCYCDGK